MIRLAALKPYCLVGLCLGLLTVVVNLGLTVLAATPFLGWLPHVVTGTGYLDDSRARVALATEEYENGQIPFDERLAAFVGISNLREAVELHAVRAAVGPRWRFLGVGGAGFGMESVNQYADLVLESGLRPDAVVIGFGLHQLIDLRPRPASVGAPGLTDHLRKGDLRSAAIELRDATWIYARREDISISAESAILDLRARMLRRFGVPLSQAEAERGSPWREMIKADWPDHFSDATLRAQEQFYADLGMFDARLYEESPKSMARLMSIIQRFQDRQAKVFLLLVPEHTSLRTRIPATALDVLQRQVRAHFRHEQPVLLDFRDVIDDEGFVDLAHMNRTGSAEFSRELADALRALLPEDGPSLMASIRLNRGNQ